MKKVESIWAELSAKAQEASKEVELSEEQIELSIAAEISALEDLASNLDKMASDYYEAAKEVTFKIKGQATSAPLLPKTRSVKAEQGLKALAAAGMKDSRVYKNLERAVEQYNEYSARSKRLQSFLADIVNKLASQNY